MTKSTITREQLTEWVAQLDSDGGCDATDKQLETLIRQSLAAMDSEPEYLPLDYLQGHKDGLEWASQLAEANHPETGDWLYDDPIELAKAIRKGPDMPPAQPVADSEPVIVVGDDGGDALSYRRLIQSFEPGTKLYRHAQPAAEREQVRSAHAEWSQATFGNVGPVGPLKHLSKEALEAAEQPGDLSEWADMQFLLWDAQRRAGITDEQITQAMIEKLAVNKQRKWPEPKDGEPRMHIKEQPAPVVGYVPLGDSPYDIPYSMPSNLRELIAEEIGILFSDDDAQSVWNVCRRAAMLSGGKS
ncbi:Eaa1 [Klebsiella pneumoniae]|nr:Eaa1 [Klebsiella pneumoniae]